MSPPAAHPPRRTARPRQRRPRDNAKLRVASYLSERADGATRNEISQKSDIRKRGDADLKSLLDEMAVDGWITGTPTTLGGGMTAYALAGAGRAALEQARSLIAQGHPLSSLDAFDGI